MITFEEIEGEPNPLTLERINTFYQSIFAQTNSTEFNQRINSARKLFIGLALSDEEMVGLKLGYQIDSEKFYSCSAETIRRFSRILSRDS